MCIQSSYLAALVVAAFACNSSKPAPAEPDPIEAPRGSVSIDAAAATTLAVDHVRLLHTEAEVEARGGKANAMVDTMKAVEAAISAYDVAHPKTLPDELDAYVVGRPHATRVWLVGAAGDIKIPELDATLGAIAPMAVAHDSIAVVVTIARPGHAADREPTLPSSWKSAAASTKSGMSMDGVLDVVWPPAH